MVKKYVILFEAPGAKQNSGAKVVLRSAPASSVWQQGIFLWQPLAAPQNRMLELLWRDELSICDLAIDGDFTQKFECVF